MCMPHIQSVSNTKRITRIENCGAHVRVRTPTRITNLVCIVCSRMSDTRRVEGPFTIYRRRPMGFPSVSWVSPHPFVLGGLCEILERDGRRPCREHAGKEKGKLSAILSGVCPRGGDPTADLHDNLVRSRPAGSDGRDALNPPTGSRCKRKFGDGNGSLTREERMRRPGGDRDGGGGLWHG